METKENLEPRELSENLVRLDPRDLLERMVKMV